MNLSITPGTVVNQNYRVIDADGQLVDAGREPMTCVHGGFGGTFAAIEAALSGCRVGESVTVVLKPAEAFGEYAPALIDTVAREASVLDPVVGMLIESVPGGSHDPDHHLYRVTDVHGDRVVLDGNHPLAGMALVFTGTVRAIRRATAMELAQGRPGPGRAEAPHDAGR